MTAVMTPLEPIQEVADWDPRAPWWNQPPPREEFATGDGSGDDEPPDDFDVLMVDFDEHDSGAIAIIFALTAASVIFLFGYLIGRRR